MGKHSLFAWLFVLNVKTGTRRIIRLEELSSVVRLEDSSSGRPLASHEIGRFYTRGRIMRLDELGQTFVIRLVIRL